MSSKLSTFICQKCGTETSQYFGKCLNCNSWNSIVEEIKNKRSKNPEFNNNKKSISFNEISSKKYQDLQVVLENLIEFLEVE